MKRRASKGVVPAAGGVLLGAGATTAVLWSHLPAMAMVGIWAGVTLASAVLAFRRQQQEIEARVPDEYLPEWQALETRATQFLESLDLPPDADVGIYLDGDRPAFLWGLRKNPAHTPADLRPFLDAPARDVLAGLTRDHQALLDRLDASHPQQGPRRMTVRAHRPGPDVFDLEGERRARAIDARLRAFLDPVPTRLLIREYSNRIDVLFLHEPPDFADLREDMRERVAAVVEEELAQSAARIGPLARPFAPTLYLRWPLKD